MNFRRLLYYFLTIITFLLVLYSCIDIVFENDTFYTIKIGQYILNNGIDMKDHYSWISGLSYTYPHWLFDVIVAIIYNLFSFEGLFIMSFILYGLVGLVLYFTLSKLSNNKVLSIILSLLSIIIIRNYAALRAQIVSYSLIILFYYNLLNLLKTSNKKYIIWLILISIIVANIHVAVWLFLLILFLPFFGEKICEYIINKKNLNINISTDKYNIKLLVLSFILVLLSGLLTPLGFVPYTYLINTMRGVTQFYINEHQPIVLWRNKFLLFYVFMLFICLYNKKVKLNDIFLLLGLSIMMLSSTRHLTLFTILTVFIFVKYFNKEKLKKIKLKNYKYFYKVVGITSLVLLLWYPILVLNKGKLKQELIPNAQYPVEAVKYIKNNLDYKNMRIFNSYNYGSYLLFNDIKVYIDSRADLYTKEFNKDFDYFIEYQELSNNNYKDIFDKYSIDYALVYRDSGLNRMLFNDDKYYIIYEDDYFVVYLKNK